MESCTHPLRNLRGVGRRARGLATRIAPSLVSEPDRGCADCTHTHDIVWHLERVSSDPRRHLVLVRCAACQSYYEVPSVGRSGIVRITRDQAARWYPSRDAYGAPPAAGAAAETTASARHLHLAG